MTFWILLSTEIYSLTFAFNSLIRTFVGKEYLTEKKKHMDEQEKAAKKAIKRMVTLKEWRPTDVELSRQDLEDLSQICYDNGKIRSEKGKASGTQQKLISIGASSKVNNFMKKQENEQCFF